MKKRLHFRSNITKVQDWAEGYINRTYHLRNGEHYLIVWHEGWKGTIQRFFKGNPGSRMVAEMGYDKHKNIYAIIDSFSQEDKHFEFVFTFTKKTVRFETVESDIINY